MNRLRRRRHAPEMEGMRVLVATVPASGHVLPLLPLARRLHQLGDDVLWATGPDQCEKLASEPFAKAAVGPPFALWFQQLASRTRGRPGDGIPPLRTTHWFAPRLFGEVGAPLMVDGLLECARSFKPDVVLFESRCYAAPAVARVVGALSVLQAVTTLMPPEVEVLVGDAVTPMWRQLGLDPPSYAGVFQGLTLSAWPASLDDPAPYGNLTVARLAPPETTPARPPWLDDWRNMHDARPLIYATLGTVFGGNTKVLRAMLEGLADDDYVVLMTVGHAGDPAALAPLPPRVRVERFVPQDAVLPICAGVVSHGGSGTTLGALAHGLPHVLVPQGADQYLNADRCERLGLGRALLGPAVTPEALGGALREVLAQPSYRDNARRVQAEMAGALNADQAATLIRDALDASGS
jgi:UDP:flavonoid glycosyltransferase YjiC (YdhE family)